MYRALGLPIAQSSVTEVLHTLSNGYVFRGQGQCYVYWWVDGIHAGLRSENSDGQCLLVIIGVKPDGSKERVAIGDGYRETKASWLELLLDLKARGLQAGPRLAVGDGAMGFWAALEDAFPATQGQRCWFHYADVGISSTKWAMCSMLCRSRNRLARRPNMQAIWMAATRAEAHTAFDRFVSINGAKYPKVTETLKNDRESLLALYDYPVENWQHLRTTNAIESTFATVRHRTARTRNCVSRPTFLGLAFKLIEEAEKTWRRINGPEKIKLLLDGIAFKDGEPVQDDQPVQQKLAA
ncbi:IS256 family transposase [Burkholderia sp. Ac-20353]|nr:IS256 family transposase [Burkholderia sp. Ac-20353]